MRPARRQDPARKQFVKDSAADKWLVREQRKPWT